jgi:hypothetical protein
MYTRFVVLDVAAAAVLLNILTCGVGSGDAVT